jgi:hypothetical protein
MVNLPTQPQLKAITNFVPFQLYILSQIIPPIP